MASITQRGEFQFQAQVRRKGYETQSKAFESKKNAEKWARHVESSMDKILFKDWREVESTALK